MKKQASSFDKTELLGGVLFPLFTLFLILRDDPLKTNLSWIGNGLGYRLLILIWAVAGALVFRAMIRALAEALHVSLKRREDLTFLLMVLSMVVPYLPETFPLLAQLHVLISNLAFIALNLLILRVFYQGQKRRWSLGRRGMEMTRSDSGHLRFDLYALSQRQFPAGNVLYHCNGLAAAQDTPSMRRLASENEQEAFALIECQSSSVPTPCIRLFLSLFL